jgi:ABC-type transport system involved in multi-copper enzyme maturation permease subunit
MFPILRYILKNGLRDRLYVGLFIIIAIALGISVFLGSTMLVEQNQSSIVFAVASIRSILSIGMILFVVINISRAFDNKEIEFILSKSISREQFILAYLIGFFLANLIILLPIYLLILIANGANKLGVSYWFITLIFENFIVISFALLSSLILKNSFTAILASIVFYALSRLMGMFVMAIELPQDYAVAKNNFLATGLKILSVIFPRLDLFAQSSWTIYGVQDNGILQIIFIQFFIYIALMIFMAFHDFKKKQF